MTRRGRKCWKDGEGWRREEGVRNRGWKDMKEEGKNSERKRRREDREGN